MGFGVIDSNYGFSQGNVSGVGVTTNPFLDNLGAAIEFYGTNAYPIPTTFNSAQYQNLFISDSGIKTLSAGITTIIRQKLTINGVATLELGAANMNMT